MSRQKMSRKNYFMMNDHCGPEQQKLLFGVLHPAYKSYKALKTKDSKAHVKWMMYWIVFAVYTSIETFSDVVLSWLPFYYEVKILFLVFLISPWTNGASILFRKFIHPRLHFYEKEIDEAITNASERGIVAFRTIGAKTINFAASTMVTTALRSVENISALIPSGNDEGHGMITDSLRRSQSLSDISFTSRRPISTTSIEEISDDDVSDSGLSVHSRSSRTGPASGDFTTRRRVSSASKDLAEVPESEENLSSEKVFIVKRGKVAQPMKDQEKLSTLRSNRQKRGSLRRLDQTGDC